ncbi:STY0301 family protein [Rhodanobacter sp. Root561]|uniref:STY0301 family protein n=1 Tax=Rhodanobacter sp. Root561 TaxID=1736560 RepID=UPI000ABBEB8C|nr:STY0301 family protein [Rhodanobacter sp. Root561]
MLLSLDRRVRRAASLALIVATGCAATACATPASVCPQRGHARVQQIDIFDGNPKDQAFLAPDDPDKAPDSYTLGPILDHGGKVTVRCHYDDDVVRDVALTSHERTCRYLEPQGRVSAALICK